MDGCSNFRYHIVRSGNAVALSEHFNLLFALSAFRVV
jgi:hypothetical protein